MAKSKQSGFTIVELMIALAIMSMLSIIAFKGQSALRAQSQFDADVDRLVASIAQVRDDSTSGLNTVGNGNGTNEACNASDTGQTVFAGDEFVANNALIGSRTTAFELEYYKSNPGQDSCVFYKQSISVPSGVEVTASGQGQELFVRTSSGSMDACPEPVATDPQPIFEAGSCVKGSWTINLTDSDGHTSSIVIDSSGLAKRVN